MSDLIRTTLAGAVAVSAALAVAAVTTSANGAGASAPEGAPALSPVVDLQGARGVEALGHGFTLVTEGDGSFSLVVERPHGAPYKAPLGTLDTDFAPAVAVGRAGTVYLLTGAAEPPEDAAMRELAGEAPLQAPAAGATLYRWHLGLAEPRPMADIGAYQQTDPDPYDLEDLPGDSNPFGLAALRGGGVLVADAAGNDVLRVTPNGTISTVARLRPRVVPVPPGLPDVPPEEGGPLPPAGTPIPSEGVATSVAVGPDGAWYVGELRGFPATPGTSQVWRIERGSRDATCNPAKPRRGACTRYADGLTSVVGLGADDRDLYAVELSKASWLQLELGVPGAETGALIRMREGRGAVRQREIAPDQLTLPGGVDGSEDGVYVTGPVFGPGALFKLG